MRPNVVCLHCRSICALSSQLTQAADKLKHPTTDHPHHRSTSAGHCRHPVHCNWSVSRHAAQRGQVDFATLLLELPLSLAHGCHTLYYGLDYKLCIHC